MTNSYKCFLTEFFLSCAERHFIWLKLVACLVADICRFLGGRAVFFLVLEFVVVFWFCGFVFLGISEAVL